MNLPQLLPEQSACTACDLHEPPLVNPGLPSRLLSPEVDPSRPAVLYVGRNPGLNENDQHACFVGQSGQLLQRVYVDGISLLDHATVYLSNIVRRYTIDNEPPRAPHYNACHGYLSQDIRSICSLHPRLFVITLGGECTAHFYRRFLGRKAMSLTKAFAENGTLVHWEDCSFQLFSMYHPAGVLRDHNLILSVSLHNQLILDHLSGLAAVPSKPHVVPPRSP